MNNETLSQVVSLELGAAFKRRLGLFDEATGCQGLADALRSGQLSYREFCTSDVRCRLFGGRALGL